MSQLSATKRRRLTVDLPPESEAATRALADRYFRGVTADAVRASLSLLSWVLEARRSGKRVVAVPAEGLPDRYEEPVLTGVEEQLNDSPTWLVARPHPWRRQLWIKGRRVTAGDLARTVEIEGWTPEMASTELGLPIEAVLEAQRYLAQNRELVEAEERENAFAAQQSSLQPA